MIRTEKVPFLQSTAAPVVLLCTCLVMIAGCFVPFSFLGRAVGMVPLPLGYWPFLIVTLLCYCVLTQFLKTVFIRKFKSWL